MTSHQLLENSQALCNAMCLSRAQWKDFVAEGILYLVKEHEDIRMIMAWKCHPYCLPFTVLGVTLDTTGGEKCSKILSSCALCEL